MRLFARLSALVSLSVGCGSVPAPLVDPPPPPAPPSDPPVLAAAATATEAAPSPETTAPSAPDPLPPCAPDMVFIAQTFCIDRYEATMVDKATRRPFSPFYPPSRKEVRRAIAGQKWGQAALGKEEIEPPVPLLPEWERGPDV